jgi:hypothetical protein
MAIAGPVDRRQHFSGEARGLLQNIFDHVEREIRIDALVDCAIEFADMAHHEQRFVDGSAVGHCPILDGLDRFGARRPAARVPLKYHFLRNVKCALYKQILLY